MFVVPAELDERRQAYCEARRIQTLSLIGYGLEGLCLEDESSQRRESLPTFEPL
jgi:hypothetical protein